MDYSSLDNYICENILMQAKLHPFIYSRKASPPAMGNNQFDYENEYKLLLPFSEVIEGLHLLNETQIF